MADILPFIGMRFNSQLIGNLSKVLCPPYDCIDQDFRDELYERHSNNIVRLEQGKDEKEDDAFSNKYTRAANTLGTWRSDGILIEDEKPAFYLYEQEFKQNGVGCKRLGFFTLVRLEDGRNAKVRGHATASAAAKEDRLELLRATHSNISPIFTVFEDKDNKVATILQTKTTEKPWEEVTDDAGIVHRLWVVQKKDFVLQLIDLMKERTLYIADGHHRYETALDYREECREETGKKDGKQPFDYTMMFLTLANPSNINIKATHRVLSRSVMKEINLDEAIEELESYFDIAKDKINFDKIDSEAERIMQKLSQLSPKGHTIGMAKTDGTVFLLTLRKDVETADLFDEEISGEIRDHDVAILHHYIINQVMIGNPEFEFDDDECMFISDTVKILNLLKTKKAHLAFLLNPPSLDSIMQLMTKGEKLPPRATCIGPKVITGLVIRNMQVEAKKTAKR